MGDQLRLPGTDDGHTSRRWVVLGCGKAKRQTAAPLLELYTGNLFQARRRYAEANLGGVDLIVSALLHLADARVVSAPYDMDLSRQSRELRAAWQRVVLERALEITEPGDTLIVLASGEYAGLWCDELARLGRYVDRPLARMSMGKQLAWLRDRTPTASAPKLGTGNRAELEARWDKRARLALSVSEPAAPSHGRFAPRFDPPPSLVQVRSPRVVVERGRARFEPHTPLDAVRRAELALALDRQAATDHEAEDARAILAGEGAAPPVCRHVPRGRRARRVW